MLKRALLAALAALSVFAATPALAHHQGDVFPIPRSLFVQELEMERTGVWRWTYEQECTNCNILPDIAGAFDDTSQRYGVYFLPDSTGISQRNISMTGAKLAGSCGAQATACVGSDSPGYPRNCDAKYDGAYMATFYSFASRKSVPKHEWMHCSTRRAEDYDDNQNDGTPGLNCIASDSIMGCGPQSPKDYTAHDDRAWATEHAPAKVTEWGKGSNDGGRYIFWKSTDARATRVAIMAYRPSDGRYRWTYTFAPAPLNQYEGALVDGLLEPGEIPCFNLENPVTTLIGRNDICVP